MYAFSSTNQTIILQNAISILHFAIKYAIIRSIINYIVSGEGMYRDLTKGSITKGLIFFRFADDGGKFTATALQHN